jgi:hypothetical protein
VALCIYQYRNTHRLASHVHMAPQLTFIALYGLDVRPNHGFSRSGMVLLADVAESSFSQMIRSIPLSVQRNADFWTRLSSRYSTCLAPACLSQAWLSDHRSTSEHRMGASIFTCKKPTPCFRRLNAVCDRHCDMCRASVMLSIDTMS